MPHRIGDSRNRDAVDTDDRLKPERHPDVVSVGPLPWWSSRFGGVDAAIKLIVVNPPSPSCVPSEHFDDVGEVRQGLAEPVALEAEIAVHRFVGIDSGLPARYCAHLGFAERRVAADAVLLKQRDLDGLDGEAPFP